jgi:hypothetical protein
LSWATNRAVAHKSIFNIPPICIIREHLKLISGIFLKKKEGKREEEVEHLFK